MASVALERNGVRLRRFLIALIFCATALNYVDRQVLALLKPTLQAEFGWTESEFGYLGSAFQLASAVALFGVGWFVDRFGVKFAYGLAVAIWSLAGIGHALATTVQQFVVARITLAAAEAVNTPAAIKAAAQYMPLRERSLAIGIINTAPNIGAILTPLLIPPIALAFGWKMAFIATGALGFVWLVFWIGGTRNLEPIQAEPAERQRADWGALFRDRKSWAVMAAKALTDQVWWFVLFWMPDFFNREYGMGQASLGYPVAIIFTLAALGALSSGGIFPLLLARGMSVNRARKLSMFVYALVILPLPLALFAGSPWIAALIIGLALFAHQGFSTNIFGMTADIVPTNRVASVIAAGAIAGNLSGMGIILFTGWALDTGLGYWPMFAMSASAYLLALLAIHILVPVLRPYGDAA
ncbi:MFS transporter [Parasphingopyxis algicola]|uniref:MFS transporter n=1 Tax=Parasphingopyxis algicola TaxID=2026624 RepID=UPI001FEC899A|nr:MFS transporter [Parasphingopyxis algicola]